MPHPRSNSAADRQDRLARVPGTAISFVEQFEDCASRVFRNRSYATLAGKVVVRRSGGSLPRGLWMKLGAPILVDGVAHAAVHVDAYLSCPTNVTHLHGRLDVGAGYVRLTGVSNVGQGEPMFDGHGFTDRAGRTLDAIAWRERRASQDEPARILVVGANERKVWIGSLGGLVDRRARSPFHGFEERANVRRPTPVELDAVTFEDGHVQAFGRALTQVHRVWFLDRETRTLYRVLHAPRPALLGVVSA